MQPRKFFFFSHSFHISTPFAHPFWTFLSDISSFDTPSLHLSTLPTVFNFKRCNQFLLEIDPCCYGSDYVFPRNSCQLQVNSCWLFLILPFQPQTCDPCWSFYSAIQRFLLVKYFGSSRLDQLYSWNIYITSIFILHFSITFFPLSSIVHTTYKTPLKPLYGSKFITT